MKCLNFKSLVEYLFLITIILSGASMYSAMNIFGLTSNSFFMYLSIVFSFVLICLGITKTRKLKLKSKDFIVVLAFIIHNLLYLVISNYHRADFIKSYMLPIYVYVALFIVYSNLEGYHNLVKKYCNIIIAVAGLSIFFYIFGTLLNILPGSSEISYTKMNLVFHCKTYYGLYFEAQTQMIGGFKLIRNSGVFMEAPGFAMPLTITLVVELFKKEPSRKWVIFLIILTGITTFSTKVFITMTFVLVAYFFTLDLKKGTKLYVFRIVLAPTILVTAAIIIVVAMLIKSQENSASFLGRMDSLQASIKVWFDHPLFGSGYKNDDSIRAYYTHIKSQYNGITAGLTCILAEGGIWLFLQYLYSTISISSYLRKVNKKLGYVFVLIYIIYLFQSSIQFKAISYIIIAMGIVEPLKANRERIVLNSDVKRKIAKFKEKLYL